jgi:hypothetical protein
LEETENQKSRQKSEDSKILTEYNRIRDEAIAEKEAIKMKTLNTGKLIQESHLKQIVNYL